MNSITRDVYVKRKALNSPISYIRATNAQKLEFWFRDFTIPENTEARVYVQKPSGRAVYNNAVIEKDTVTVDVTTQMFSEIGKCYLQLHLVKEERTLVTFAQPVNVLQNYTEGDVLESQNESGFFQEYEDRLDEIIDAADTATTEIRGKIEEAVNATKEATEAAGSANSAADEAYRAANEAGEGANAATSAATVATEAADSATEAANLAIEVKNQIQEKADNGDFTGTIRIGTVITGEPGTSANVENIGTDKDAILDITIPRGETGKVENIDNTSIEFIEAGERKNIESKDSFKIIFGKIKKFFLDIKTVAFTGKFADLIEAPKAVNNLDSDSIVDYLAAAQGKEIKKQIAELTEKVYPIGSIYINTRSINPSEFFCGSWIAWGSGRVPVGVDTSQTEFNYVEKIGGDKTHTLTMGQIPSHNHNSKTLSGSIIARGKEGVYTLMSPSGIMSLVRSAWSGKHAAFNSADVTTACEETLKITATHTHDSQGSGQSHNNLQPYITCYMWKRIG